MDIKQLLEKMDQFAGQAVGQQPGDQWRGTDSAPPGKKLVGDSILKDLKKGLTPKTKEQELAEEWAMFSEEDIGTHPKRPGRKSDRHARGHEPQPRYTTVKADEGAMGDKDIELQDYRSMSHKEFQTAYGMTKTEWINKNKSLVIKNPNIKKGLGLDEAGNPAQQAAIAIAMKKAGKKPKNEDTAYKATNQHPASRDPIVATVVKQMRPGLTGLDMGNEAFLYFAYELGKQRARDAWSDYLPAIRAEYEKGLNEDANTDNKLAKLLTRFVDQNEGAAHAVVLDAIEYIKKIGHIEQFATSLDYFGVDLDEGWESGPEEYEEPYDDADDAYDRQRQEKIDTEAEKEWAKLPKVSTYQCTGRGANMEPNQKFGPEFDTLEKALEYRAEIMKDPKTPHPEHIGINTLTRVVDKQQTNEGIESSDPIEGAVLDAVQELIQQGHTDVAPEVITNMVVAATSQPFLLKDLVDANKNSPAIQHYIDSINPSKVKFSSDILTVKNENPAKAKAQSQGGVAKMAAKAASRPRLGENSVTTPKNPEHAKQMMKDLGQLRTQVPNPDPELAATINRRKDILMKQAKDLGIDESRAHKILNTWFKNHERQEKFAKGELAIPTPQERRAELEKPKKQVKEYGADQPQGTAAPGGNLQQDSGGGIPVANDPKTQQQAKDITQATNTLKSATGTSAPSANIVKALNTAMQGKSIGGSDIKTLEPMMDILGQAAQDPKVAQQFKTVAQAAKQSQQQKKV
jgi:hypothetical protein